MDDILFAILVKDKAVVLPMYLDCLLKQTYDKKKIHLQIRTNDNKDNSEDILQEFVQNHGHLQASIYFNSNSIDDTLKKFAHHEWNNTRFKILSRIRIESIVYAHKKGCHYFVCDVDNFVKPSVLQEVVSLKHLGVIAPMLNRPNHLQSNFFSKVDKNGYFANDNFLQERIVNRQITGVIQVPLVHCTYFVPHKNLPDIVQDDNSGRYEFVIMSDVLRKRKVLQYIDNRKFYGIVTFSSEPAEIEKDVQYFHQH